MFISLFCVLFALTCFLCVSVSLEVVKLGMLCLSVLDYGTLICVHIMFVVARIVLLNVI